MPYDPFGQDHMMYTVSNRILELPDHPYEDGARTIFLYTKGTKGNLSENIKQLLHYMEDTRNENAKNEDLRNIQEMVDAVKENRELRTNYMKLYEKEQRFIRQINKEHQRAERERQRAEQECQRADALANELARLKEELYKRNISLQE